MWNVHAIETPMINWWNRKPGGGEGALFNIFTSSLTNTILHTPHTMSWPQVSALIGNWWFGPSKGCIRWQNWFQWLLWLARCPMIKWILLQFSPAAATHSTKRHHNLFNVSLDFCPTHDFILLLLKPWLSSWMFWEIKSVCELRKIHFLE